MSIHYGSKRSLVNYINSVNRTGLVETEVDLGPPSPVKGTWREGLVAGNTVIAVIANSTSNFQGRKIVTYDRLNLDDFNKVSALSVKAFKPAALFDFFAPLRRRYGIVLTPDDFIDGPFEFRGEDAQIVEIKAKGSAVGWTGTLSFTASPGGAILGQHLTTLDLPGLNYPVEGDGAQGSALSYMYGLDFTSSKAVLEKYKVGQKLTVADAGLLAAVKATDNNTGKNSWTLDPAVTTWSLGGAEVVYSGINSPVLPSNSSYKYVLGLLLRTDVTTPPGVCYLHYNDPVDPNQV